MQRIFQKGKIHRRDIILFFLWIPLVSLIVTGIATDKPTIFGVRPMIVITDSMVPAIPIGSIIIGVPVETEEVQVGDIIAYRIEEKNKYFSPIIVHRVVGITEDGFIFQGDNNIEPDDNVVRKAQILFKIILQIEPISTS